MVPELDDPDTHLSVAQRRELLRLDVHGALADPATEVDLLFLRASDAVLDAGCGAGAHAIALADAVPLGRVVGVDEVDYRLERAKRRVARLAVDNVSFELADLTALPFADASFDVVWSRDALQNHPKRAQALAELVRVTRPGGRVVLHALDAWGLEHQWPLPDEETMLMWRRWRSFSEQRHGTDPMLGRKLYAMLRAAGLQDLRIHLSEDPVYGGAGAPQVEQLHAWQLRVDALQEEFVEALGSREAAEDFRIRLLENFGRPDVYRFTTLFHAEGRKPRGEVGAERH